MSDEMDEYDAYHDDWFGLYDDYYYARIAHYEDHYFLAEDVVENLATEETQAIFGKEPMSFVEWKRT